MESKTEETKNKYILTAIRIKKNLYEEASVRNPKIAENHHTIKLNKKNVKLLDTLYSAAWLTKYESKNYKPNTWRQYRSSLIYYAEQELQKEKIKKEDFLKIKKILYSTSGGNKKEIPDRTSASKKKNINEKDFNLLKDALEKSKNRWSNVTIIWLNAGILTGLRPIEWQTVEIDNNKNFLYVKNAKNTNGRAHGEYRTINIEHLDNSEKNIIYKQIEISQRFYNNGLWDSYYTGCSNILRYTSRKIFKNRKKYPTLYTGRHQYSANLKSVGCKPEEIATLMGHSSDQTNQSHYGRRRYGRGKVKPKINRQELKNVKIKIKERPFKFE